MKTSATLDFEGNLHIRDQALSAVGFGTYPLKEKVCTAAVSEALQQKYTILDTATFYDNFEAIASAMKGHKRENIYLISKVWHDSHTKKGVEQDFKDTLERLCTPYLDAYLLHWPNSKVPIEETLGALETLRKKDEIRDIGLSNVTVNHLKRALEVGVPITWVQVEMHVDFVDEALLDFCRENGLIVQAWRPLNLGKVCKDYMLSEIGKPYGKKASQVALRWIIQKGVLPLPGSSNPEHIAENRNLFDFSLTADEMEAINQRARKGKRARLKLEQGMGFEDEFDFSYQDCWPKNLKLQ